MPVIVVHKQSPLLVFGRHYRMRCGTRFFQKETSSDARDKQLLRWWRLYRIEVDEQIKAAFTSSSILLGFSFPLSVGAELLSFEKWLGDSLHKEWQAELQQHPLFKPTC